MIKYIDKNIPRYKPPKNVKGKGKGPSKGTTVWAKFKAGNSNLIFFAILGKHNIDDPSPSPTYGRAGGGAEEKVGHLEGDVHKVQHWGGAPGGQRGAKHWGGGDDQLADEAERPTESSLAELDMLEGAQDLHLPDLQGRLHSPLQKVPPDCPEQKLWQVSCKSF